MTSLPEFALHLSQSFKEWTSPQRESSLQYFTGNVSRHGGDEIHLRSSLIQHHVLHRGFGYDLSHIQIEDVNRADMVLYGGTAQSYRPVAIVETKKSGFGDLLHTVQANGETPVQQLERYLRVRGLYLGLLTNGDNFHFIDFSVGYEPRASLSLVELSTLLALATSPQQADDLLNKAPHLRDALLILQRGLEASTWLTIDTYLESLNDTQQFHSVSLNHEQDQAGLVTRIKQELGILSDTVLAQFALLQSRLSDYSRRVIQVNDKDERPAISIIADEQEKIITAVPDVAQSDIRTLLIELTEAFMDSGDADIFYARYMLLGQDIARRYGSTQLSLLGQLEQTTTHSAFSLPPIDALLSLIDSHFTYRSRLHNTYESSLKMEQAYLEWKRRVKGVFQAPEQEFCLQTSYIHFVRLFFVRVCEDYGLIGRRISNGPFGRFDEYRRELLNGVSHVFNRLLEESYERAATVYHNFFNRQDLYDWFQMDEQSILALLAVLNHYDFSELTFDILGKCYNEGYIEEHSRSERGQFYTPYHVVQYMIDGMGIPPLQATTQDEVSIDERQLIRATVIDLSCGSGSFLVELAARKAAVLQRLVRRGEIQNAEAIDYIVGTLTGFDINPFACYLAEINILIRCMPFLKGPQGEGLAPSVSTIQRLNIYCADALEPTRREIISDAVSNTLVPNPDTFALRHERVTEEEKLVRLIKDSKTTPHRLGRDRQGFDYVIGNPPYVRADENPEQLAYRERIRGWGIYRTLRLKWDLFVPFIYRNLMFLAPGGVLALITSNAIETEGYSTLARETLNRLHLLRLDFFPDVRLFSDAAVHNTIFTLRNVPILNEQVIQRVHKGPSCDLFTEVTKSQAIGADAIFRHAYEAPTIAFNTCVIPLCALVYIGTGIEAQSDEKRSSRHFTLEESFRLKLDDLPITERVQFVDRGVLGADVQHYHLTNIRYVAYDAMKDDYRRRRFPELFRTSEKLLLGETSGGYYDSEGLFANHSVQVAVPWHQLDIKDDRVRKTSETMSGYHSLADVARHFDLRYLLAVANSRYMRQHIQRNMIRGTRQTRVYPDVWKMIPIKVIPLSAQRTIGEMVVALQDLYRQQNHYPTSAAVISNWQQSGRLSTLLRDYVVQGYVEVFGTLNETKQSSYEVTEDNKVILYRNNRGLSTAPSHRSILEYFCLYCNDVAPSTKGKIWLEMRNNIPMPATIAHLEMLMAEVQLAQQAIESGAEAIITLTNQIEDVVISVYQKGCDTELFDVLSNYRSTATESELLLFSVLSSPEEAETNEM